jgi:hypothetical protein
LLFAAALTQVAFHWGPDAASSGPGWRLLLRGWQGLGAGYPEWLANPLLLVSWLGTFGQLRRTSAVCAAAAAALMLVFPFRTSLAPFQGGPNLHDITPGPGYWLWLASAVVMAAGMVVYGGSRPGQQSAGDDPVGRDR